VKDEGIECLMEDPVNLRTSSQIALHPDLGSIWARRVELYLAIILPILSARAAAFSTLLFLMNLFFFLSRDFTSRVMKSGSNSEIVTVLVG